MIYLITYDLIIDGHSRLNQEKDIFLCHEKDINEVQNIYKQRLQKRLTPWQKASNIKATLSQ